jgi:hypothetical protein
MFILLIDVDDDTRSVVFNDLSLHDNVHFFQNLSTMNILDPIFYCTLFLIFLPMPPPSELFSKCL